MKIELRDITLKDLINGFADKAAQGVSGHGGKLDICPPDHWDFINKANQRNAVIDTVWRVQTPVE